MSRKLIPLLASTLLALVSLVEDGVYGRHSRDAVTWVQRHRNLTPDGVYGPSTHNNMTWDTFGPERGCAYPHAV